MLSSKTTPVEAAVTTTVTAASEARTAVQVGVRAAKAVTATVTVVPEARMRVPAASRAARVVFRVSAAAPATPSGVAPPGLVIRPPGRYQSGMAAVMCSAVSGNSRTRTWRAS
jgi:hypothetical protein